RGGAGGGRAARAVDLHEAQPARAERLQRVGGAQLRDVDARELGRPHDRRARRDRHRDPVDRELHGGGALAGGRAVVRLLQQAHRWKSSPKWRTALRTGMGVSPPMAQSDPSVISSHRSSSSTRFFSRSWPGRMRSIVSTPRTAPTRHGVHLPHDSSAQKENAKRAISAMSTVSSKTTTPPWPSIAPASANAS